MRHDGKRLLVLGATPYSINVIKTAQSMGAFVITVDPVADHVAKKYANKSFDINTTDIEKLYNLCIKEKIDGVFTGYSDVNLLPCRKLCDKLGLPFYAGEKQILNTIDKLKFKAMCKKYDVGTVPQYCEDDLKNVKYPIIIKPSDSYASKGITVCYNYSETKSALIKAKKYSPTNTVIIEKYMGGLKDVNIDYVMQDGNIILSAVGDRFVNTSQKGLSPLTAAVVYPSKYVQKYIDTIDLKVKRMFCEEGFSNGTVFIQSFFDGDDFYFFEMGYRVGGGQSSMMIRDICGLDYVENLINFAFTGKMDNTDLRTIANPFFKKKACCLVPCLKQGTIANISGIDSIRLLPECKNITQFYEEGETVPQSSIGNLGQSFLRIHLVADNWETLNRDIEIVNENLKVTSVIGHNMILEGAFEKIVI